MSNNLLSMITRIIVDELILSSSPVERTCDFCGVGESVMHIQTTDDGINICNTCRDIIASKAMESEETQPIVYVKEN